ncbi:hypothetical protein ACOKM5_24285 [Streptomyces sp. BH097]|uniref:hypothetical protein n=1 Tax=Streptomyces sp. BH097 TaxID=3410406 RepID=UPI003CEAAB2C
MTHIPAAITREQSQNACRALGLSPSLVRDLELDTREGVHASVFVRDREGRVITRDENPVTVTVHIPFGQEASPA